MLIFKREYEFGKIQIIYLSIMKGNILYNKHFFCLHQKGLLTNDSCLNYLNPQGEIRNPQHLLTIVSATSFNVTGLILKIKLIVSSTIGYGNRFFLTFIDNEQVRNTWLKSRNKSKLQNRNILLLILQPSFIFHPLPVQLTLTQTHTHK